MRPEFHRPLPLASVPPEGRSERISADAGERAALAARLGLIELPSLQAELEVRPEPGGGWRVGGRLEAEVVQACVVTLEPVPQRVSEAVDWRVAPPGEAGGAEDDEALDAEGPEPVEAENGVLDLGEAAAQGLSLALDPYPRAPGARLEPDEATGAGGAFAMLARLRGGGPTG